MANQGDIQLVQTSQAAKWGLEIKNALGVGNVCLNRNCAASGLLDSVDYRLGFCGLSRIVDDHSEAVRCKPVRNGATDPSRCSCDDCCLCQSILLQELLVSSRATTGVWPSLMIAPGEHAPLRDSKATPIRTVFNLHFSVPETE